MIKRFYVCSPCNAETDREIKENMRRAMEYAAYVQRQYKARAYAPHAHLPNLLADSDHLDRGLAMDFCLRLLSSCDAICVFGDKVSDGMKKEIVYAFTQNIPIYATEALIEKVRLMGEQGCSITAKPLEGYDPDEAADERSTFNNPERLHAADCINLFEDMLDAHGIKWENPERDAYENDGGTDASVIFGSEYDELLDDIQNILEDAVYYGNEGV